LAQTLTHGVLGDSTAAKSSFNLSTVTSESHFSIYLAANARCFPLITVLLDGDISAVDHVLSMASKGESIAWLYCYSLTIALIL